MLSPDRRRTNVKSEAETIEKILEHPEISKTRDEVDVLIEEKHEEYLAHQESKMPEEKLRAFVAKTVFTELANMNASSGRIAGEVEELPFLSFGYDTRSGGWLGNDGETLISLGLVNPLDDPSGIAILTATEDDGIDIDYAKETFGSLSTVRCHAVIRQIGNSDNTPTIKKGGFPTYNIESSNDSTFEVVDPSDVDSDDPIGGLPEDREAKRELIHDTFMTEEEHVTVQTYAEHEARKNSSGYDAGLGIDVKRMRGEVVDSIAFDNGGGLMTLTDDTVFSEDDVPEDLVSDQMRTPGLQVSVHSDFVYEEGSILDVYGPITQRDDTGQYSMDGFGVIPIVSFDYTDDPYEIDGSGSDEDIEEETI